MNHENESQKENVDIHFFLSQAHSILLPFTTSQLSSIKGLQTVNSMTNFTLSSQTQQKLIYIS